MRFVLSFFVACFFVPCSAANAAEPTPAGPDVSGARALNFLPSVVSVPDESALVKRYIANTDEIITVKNRDRFTLIESLTRAELLNATTGGSTKSHGGTHEEGDSISVTTTTTVGGITYRTTTTYTLVRNTQTGQLEWIVTDSVTKIVKWGHYTKPD